ncbi:unnamed protein product [Nippostrongylus brasiliensis]|uniref:Phosphatidylinositol 3-kinase age-1 (inferred by orthology to a C. elegans protein) n=1 Tax=Nippostrongylus brasiliensis TaxID=27835 RepID=A0A0N4YCR9_NIPBR|nr:unnamed protein product [Nippostrongylus brasiliensis]
MLLSKVELTRPFPMLSLFEPESFQNERDLAQIIGQALGYSLDELEAGLSDELKTCRAMLFTDTCDAVNSRGSEGYEHYAFPEAMVLNVSQPCPHSLIAKMKSANLNYQVFFRTLENEKEGIDIGATKTVVEFAPEMTPASMVARVVEDLKKSGHIQDVRSAFENYRSPQFVLRRKEIVLQDYPKPRPIHKFYFHIKSSDLVFKLLVPKKLQPNYVRAEESRIASEDVACISSGTSSIAESTDTSYITLWDIDEYLSMRPLSCSNMGTTDSESHCCVLLQISVDFSVYCGKLSLIHKASSKVPSSNPRWMEGMMVFDLYMKDLPPAAVLTVHLVETRNRKGKVEDRVLGWANIRLLDWRGELLQGVVTLNLWGGEPEYPPHGRIGNNDKKQGSTSRLVIELARYRSPRVKMADRCQFAPFVRFIRSLEEPKRMQADELSTSRILSIIRKRLLGGVVSEEEELFVWNHRHFVSGNLPDALLIITEADVTWRKREHFTELYVMLEEWGQLSVGTAFSILGKKCMDPIIRSFAVTQLGVMLDNQLFPLFILPFIQALKCEAWSYSPLSCLLLKKALCDYRIGHKLFWLLRAELANLKDSDGNVTEMYKRFALIIEAYLRGNDEHIRTVVEMVDLLHKLSVLVKSIREKDVATEYGMIGVVPNCSTIFEIQSEGGKVGTAVKSLETTFINRHIKNSAVSTKRYMECVDRFLMSCVGYSVATFIMGIMDRHNDNIMMTHDGKLFHIDFGHILGHGKTKLGIRRDRVPFVLTEHFLCVIGQGRPVSKDSHEVTKFKKLCCDAYMMLWEERDLFLSLFTVMQSMELPELSTEADLDQLKVCSSCSAFLMNLL